MRPRADWLAHGVLGLGILFFALPVWLIFAGATQDAGAINRGDLSLLPRLSHLGVFWSVLHGRASGSLTVPTACPFPRDVSVRRRSASGVAFNLAIPLPSICPLPAFRESRSRAAAMGQRHHQPLFLC
jgi:ABC-type glycerol-3-phosphate transport system permease component